jgi:hypothetical protein
MRAPDKLASGRHIGHQQRPQQVMVKPLAIKQRASYACLKITGMRSWMSATISLGRVVMIVQV